jgi:hypothetical protein
MFVFLSENLHRGDVQSAVFVEVFVLDTVALKSFFTWKRSKCKWTSSSLPNWPDIDSVLPTLLKLIDAEGLEKP